MALTLHIDKAAVGVAGAVKINWCLDAETARELKGQRAHLLIVTAPQGDKFRWIAEERQIVPVTDPLAFVSFARSGPCRVFATLLVGKTHAELADSLLSMRNGCYDTTVLGYAGDYISFAEGGVMKSLGGRPYDSAVLNVDVPKSSFGDAPEWEKPWVNWLYKEEPREQCDYRERRLVAYTVGTLLMALKLPIAFLLELGRTLLLLPRRVDFTVTRHPLTFSLRYVFKYDGGFVWVPKDDESSFQGFGDGDYRLLLTPFVPCYVLVSYLIMHRTFPKTWWPLRILYCDLAFTAIAVGIIMVIIAVGRTYAFFHRDGHKRLLALFSSLTRSRDNDQGLVTDESLAYLTCDAGPKPLRLDQIPRAQRTIRLRFLDLKADVCKPFER